PDARDSTLLLWNRGLEYARLHRLDDQTARFSMFLANDYASDGRWALASDYVADARALARALDDPARREHLMVETLEFAYRMGSLGTIRRELHIADSELQRARASA